MKICDTLLQNGVLCYHHMKYQIIINHKGQQYFQLANKWNSFIKSMTWIMMLTNRTTSSCWHTTCHVIMMGDWIIVVTYSQFDSNIRVFYVFLGFFRNTLKYFIQRPIFKPLYFYNDFLKILENTSFWAPLKNTCISYVTSMDWIIINCKVGWLLQLIN
jgi:hypothetical protein